MRILFPSPEFDEAVAAVCHGTAAEEQMVALNEVLRSDAQARDEYILRVELHARLASDRDLFAAVEVVDPASETSPSSRVRERAAPPRTPRRGRGRRLVWSIVFAANLLLAAAAIWRIWTQPAFAGVVATSRAVAMLGETGNAHWASSSSIPHCGAPLEPGWLKLESGLAQVVFYSGARVVIEGPADLQLVSANHAVCTRGKMRVDVPAQARGFQIETPEGKVTDLGTAFGLEVKKGRTEVHVFKGEVTVEGAGKQTAKNLVEGSGALMEASDFHPLRANPNAFASLINLQAKSAAGDAQRVDQWKTSSARLNRDPSLLIRFDFSNVEPSRWQLSNRSDQSDLTGDATIVGCEWGEGRWPGKRAVEFQSVSDRIRVNVPGECEAMTAAAWVRVQGLDRQLNSLFMSDGFAPGSVHWLIRNDGVLSMTVVGQEPRAYQIVVSRPVMTVEKFGMWVHLAVVVDGRTGRVAQYVNGQPVGETALRMKPPYRIGTAELGNWNGKGFSKSDPFMIRNFSGAMDEFCLFVRALSEHEINSLYAEGRPDAEIVASRD